MLTIADDPTTRSAVISVDTVDTSFEGELIITVHEVDGRDDGADTSYWREIQIKIIITACTPNWTPPSNIEDSYEYKIGWSPVLNLTWPIDNGECTFTSNLDGPTSPQVNRW